MPVLLKYVSRLLIAHTCNDNNYDKNPKDHIKIEVAAAAAVTAVVVAYAAVSHNEVLLSCICNIYYDKPVFFAFCPYKSAKIFLSGGVGNSASAGEAVYSRVLQIFFW